MSRELDFERPILELERQIEELRRIASVREAPEVARPSSVPAPILEDADPVPLEDRIAELESRSKTLLVEVYRNLTRWQVVQLSRHPNRPYSLDYFARAFSDFVELHGDRSFGDDGAIVGGLARLEGRPVLVLGHQKGRSTKENLHRNFGMARPEGYRKSVRLMRLAERFGLPIVTLIDTPGAFPGIDAEERGQAQAIAEALEAMASLSVPVIAIVIGEGGSGGALAIGVANRVLMLEYGTYSVISPEACSSILFKDPSHAAQAADALKLTAPDIAALGVIDEVIPEPLGGAHRDPDLAAKALKEAAIRHLTELSGKDGAALRRDRHERFRKLGAFEAKREP
jgi:acetyl-CoA carboxylase carboxyl transferase subunit alpha